MDMSRIELNVPTNAVPYLVTDDKDIQFKQFALLLYPYIKDETISHGKAAELLGVHKLDLIEFYSGLGLPYIDMSWEEVESDMENLRKVWRK